MKGRAAVGGWLLQKRSTQNVTGERRRRPRLGHARNGAERRTSTTRKGKGARRRDPETTCISNALFSVFICKGGEKPGHQNKTDATP